MGSYPKIFNRYSELFLGPSLNYSMKSTNRLRPTKLKLRSRSTILRFTKNPSTICLPQILKLNIILNLENIKMGKSPSLTVSLYMPPAQRTYLSILWLGRGTEPLLLPTKMKEVQEVTLSLLLNMYKGIQMDQWNKLNWIWST